MSETVIRTKGLNKKFRLNNVEIPILKGIDLEIYMSDFTVIMGSSGAGKSTLLYALSTMDKPSGGKVELLGSDIVGMEEKSITHMRKENIAFVFQSFNLIPDLTAFENIAYPAYLKMDKRKADQIAMDLLVQFGLSEQRDKYPSEMSGGQQQRVAIARAIAQRPKIIFADEPTGALDSTSGTLVLDLLTDANKAGQTIVMVTHDIKACTRGNRMIYLHDGKVVGDFDLGVYRAVDQAKREGTVFDILQAYR